MRKVALYTNNRELSGTIMSCMYEVNKENIKSYNMLEITFKDDTKLKSISCSDSVRGLRFNTILVDRNSCSKEELDVLRIVSDEVLFIN